MSAKTGASKAQAAASPPKKAPASPGVKAPAGGPGGGAVAAAGGREVCHDYARGVCTRGDACRFSHDVAISAAVKARLEVRGWQETAQYGAFLHPP